MTKQGDLFTGSAFSKVTTRTFNKRGSAVTNTYYAGSTTYERGTLFTGTAYTSSGAEYTGLLYTTGSKITKLGTSAGTLYKSDGDETVSVATEEYTAPLYVAGSSVSYTEQGEMYEGSLFYPGTEYPNGLYTNFQLAQLTTKEITALTV